MLSLLRGDRDFRLFWVGQTASMVGNFILPVALALYTAQRFDSASAVGFVLGARALGTVISLLAGGALADGWDRRKLMLYSDIGRMVLVAVLLLPGLPLVAIAALGMGLGLGEGLFYPAYNMYAVELVQRKDLQTANGLNSLGQQLASVAAPALAGLIVVVADARLCFAVDTISFAFSVVTLLMVRARPVEPERTGGVKQALRGMVPQIVSGFKEVRRRRWVMLMIAQDALSSGLVYAPMAILLPIMLLDQGHSPAVFALITTATAVGSVLGAFLSQWVRSSRPGVWAVLLTTLYGLFVLAVAAQASPIVLGSLAAVASGGREISLVLWYTNLQHDVPEASLSRVNAVDWVGSMSLAPIGQMLTGVVVLATGSAELLWVCGGVFFIITLAPLLDRGVRLFRTLQPEEASA